MPCMRSWRTRHGLVLAVEVNSPPWATASRATLHAHALIEPDQKTLSGSNPRPWAPTRAMNRLKPFLERWNKRSHNAARGGQGRCCDRRIVITGLPPETSGQHRPCAHAFARRRTQSLGYKISQRCRKKIEELFGWAKTIAGLARTRHIGHWKTNQQAHLAGAAFNLTRMRGLLT